jgi:hypothetical protein
MLRRASLFQRRRAFFSGRERAFRTENSSLDGTIEKEYMRAKAAPDQRDAAVLPDLTECGRGTYFSGPSCGGVVAVKGKEPGMKRKRSPRGACLFEEEIILTAEHHT